MFFTSTAIANITILALLFNVQLVLGFLVLLGAPRRTPNRGVAAMLLILAFISLLGILSARSLSVGQAVTMIRLLAAASAGQSAMILLASIAALRPDWLRFRLLPALLILFVVAPMLLTLLDVAGFSDALFGQPLYISVIPDVGRDQLVTLNLDEVTAGPIGRWMTLAVEQLVRLAALLGLYVLIADFRKAPRTATAAGILVLAFVTVVVLLGLLGPSITGGLRVIMIAGGVITAAFAAIGFIGIDAPFTLRGMHVTLRNWPFFPKMVLAVAFVIPPLVMFIFVEGSSLLRFRSLETAATRNGQLAGLQAQAIESALVAEIATLQSIADDATVQAALADRNGSYAGLSTADIRTQIAGIDLDWQRGQPDAALMVDVMSNPSAVVLGRVREFSPGHFQLLLIDREGAVLTALQQPAAYDQLETPWWQALVDASDRGLYVGNARFEPQLGLPLTELAVPVLAGGEFAGMIVSTYNLATVVADVETDATAGASTAVRNAVLDDAGRYVSEPESNEPLPRLGRLEVITSAQNSAIADSSTGPVLLAARPVDLPVETVTLTGTPLWVLVSEPMSSVLAASSAVQTVAFAAALLGLPLVVLVLFYISQAIIQPVRELNTMATSIRERDFTVRAEVTGVDEFGQLGTTFNAMAEDLQALTETLEARVTQRTRQLEAVIDVAHAVTGLMDVNELLSRTVRLISERFGYYHVALFLVDDTGDFAVVTESTGDIGSVFKEMGYRLAVGSNSVIGYVTANRRALNVADAENDPIYLRNSMLPYTRSELGLPLLVGTRLLGALDVQATRVNAFSDEDVETLQAMADQIAIALNNARMFAETQTQLREMQYAQRQYVREAWSSQLGMADDSLGFVLDGDVISSFDDSNGHETLAVALTQRSVLAVPLRIRGETIGTIELVHVAGREWSDDDRLLAQSVADQAGLALENARLLDEAQRRAERERLTAEIGGRIRETLDVESMLRTAAQTLQQSLGLPEVVVRLTPPGAAGDDRPGEVN